MCRYLIVVTPLLIAPALTGAEQKDMARYEVSLTRGLDALNGSRYREAAADLKKALASRPGDAQARYLLAICLGRMSKYRSSAKLLKDIIATEGDYRAARLYLGIALFGEEKWEAALDQFSQYAELHPERAEAHYYIGQCNRLLKRFDEALENLAAARELDGSYTGICRYYEGLTYLAQGKREEARGAFDEVVAAEPERTELHRAAREALSRVSKPWALNRSRFSLYTGYEYDSNVVLMPRDGSIVDISSKADWRYFVNPRFELIPFDTDRLEVSALYDFYNSTHNRLGDYNLLGHRLITSVYGKSKFVWPYVRYDFSYYLLDDAHQDYLRSHGLTAGALLIETRRMMTDISYGYYVDSYFITEPNPANDRDDHNNSVGFDHYLYLNPSLTRSLRLGFRYDRNSAEGKNFTHNGFRFTAELNAAFRHGIGMDVLAEYYPRYFPRHEDNRRDKRQLYSVEISKRMGRALKIAFRYDLLINDSTVALYQFDKNVYSLSVYYEI